MNNQQKEDTATLEILQAIEDKKDVTQRHLADRLDVALGLANSYLKRCVHKGLIKIHQAPANRYFYYLTPKGFAEKSRLTTQYLSASFDFYRQASESISEILLSCSNNGQKKIIFFGISELAEIASIRAQEFDLLIVGTVDPYTNKEKFIGRQVCNKLSDIDSYDVCLLTSLENAASYYDSLINSISRDKILVPNILGINH